MKLKNVLRFAFILLTLIPTIIVSMLMYKSCFELAKVSYTNNLNESINVQVDYISQKIESSMVFNQRFANKNFKAEKLANPQVNLSDAFQSYLEASEDEMTVSMFLDENNVLIYSMGEEAIIRHIMSQLPSTISSKNQQVIEYELSEGVTSLGILTPVWENGQYNGSMLSVFNKSYIYKIISNYYDITNTSIFICNHDGEVIRYKGNTYGEDTNTLQPLFDFSHSEGEIATNLDDTEVMGSYKAIRNTPWYLVGLIDDDLVYGFTNQFMNIYIFLVACILIIDIALSFYIANRVIKPINTLIKLMDEYQNNLHKDNFENEKTNVGYYETNYLNTKFFELMKSISFAQHNFHGIYQLYQSNDMDDTNIDIDVIAQTIHSNKDAFTAILNSIVLQKDDCVIENFVKCFCEKDEDILRTIFVTMRDTHLSTSSELEVYTPHLNQKWFHVVVVPLYENDRLSRLFIQLRDISGFKKQEIKSNMQARQDSLTNLYNRFGLIDYVSEHISNEHNESHGLLFVDMDYFKLVNDYFGHSEGDILLRKIANSLLSIVADQGIVSRLGGDEFVIFIPRTTSEQLKEIKQQISETLIYKYEYQDETFTISASVGESLWEIHSTIPFEALLESADRSMYEAKRRFKEKRDK